jgi:hypothetical protein
MNQTENNICVGLVPVDRLTHKKFIEICIY